MNALAIADTTIRQDAAGRYSLNDLHRAAGGEQRHQPRYFLANQQTIELIAELGDSGNPLSVQRGGADQGTYAAKELVYAYAMWISAAFHLKVIRAYDAMATARPADPVAALNDPATLRGLLLNYSDRVEALQPKADALDRLATAPESVCITDAAKRLQVKPSFLFGWMQSNGWIHKRAGTGWRPYQPRIDRGQLVLKVITRIDGAEIHLYDQVLVTPKGLTRLAELLEKERAPV